MKLYTRGQLDLDESISAYLLQALIGGLHRPGGVDHSDRITVRNLLGHTSSIRPRYAPPRWPIA
jgi:CubicO group peptidase (beta-lactamase class C family)